MPPFHPLDPLSAAEVEAAAAACRQRAAAEGVERLRFNTISLKEPAKKELLAWYKAGSPADDAPPRQAFCILQTPGTVEAVVALPAVATSLGGPPAKVATWLEVPGVQPLATPDDCFEAEAIVKADAEVAALLAEQYGIADLDMVACDPWSVHLPPLGGRLIQTFMYQRASPDDNHYAHPIDMVPVVDLNLGRVVRIDRPYAEKGGQQNGSKASAPSIPTLNVNYHRDLCDVPFREDLKPLNVVQPEGGSWTLEGNLIKWQKWHIRISFNYREGLVLHDVGYEDGGRVRPIMHRMSLVEMAVPYADPNPPYTRKCAFDVGDYGLGNCANSLELGCDCLGHVHYFDAVLNNSKGEPVQLSKAVCMHEEDVGLLWKHMEYRNGHAESRRSRRLVLSFIATVVNYEYGIFWYFYQDGTISYEIKLTGELSTNLVSPGEDPERPEWGTLVAPGVNAQYHQHMFSMRMDPAVDDADGGAGLVVSEVDVVAVPQGPGNPEGNAFTTKETPLQICRQPPTWLVPESAGGPRVPAMRRSALSLLALALLLGSATANMGATISGLRTKKFAKHPMLAKHVSAVVGAMSGGAVTPTAVPAECLSVAEVAQQAGTFTALLAAAQAAGLAPALSDRALQATVFAPTDEAFAAALEVLGVSAEELLAQPDLLAAVLKYHVVPGAPILSSQMSDSDKLPTLLSADLAAAAAADSSAAWHKKKDAETGELELNVLKVYGLKTGEVSRRISVIGALSSAEVVTPDVQAGCPAVVHVIDGVLLPELVAAEEEAGLWGSLLKIWGA